jgi:hypothetical protein
MIGESLFEFPKYVRPAAGKLNVLVAAGAGFVSAYVGHREQPYRRIVITRIGHRDRSEATLVGGGSGGGFGLALSA